MGVAFPLIEYGSANRAEVILQLETCYAAGEHIIRQGLYIPPGPYGKSVVRVGGVLLFVTGFEVLHSFFDVHGAVGQSDDNKGNDYSR